jgi:pimeloyl-ACP methyl ester carboxylesterase
MPGDARRFAWDEGSVHYVVTGAGTPLVLVHGLGVAASSFEFRYVVELFARSHTVYTPDLLGFGLSDHPPLAYSGSTYIRLLADFLEREVRVPAVLVGCGLSALYCIAVAAAKPEAVSAVALCMPGFPDGRPDLPEPMRSAVDGILSAPLVGQSLFRLLTARNAIRSHLRERAYTNPDLVTESMVDAQYAMAHQPNALLAPHAYLAGRLAVDVSHQLASLAKPVLVVAGSSAVPSPRRWLAHYVRLSPRARVTIIASCGALPHEEQPEHFVEAIRTWIDMH